MFDVSPDLRSDFESALVEAAAGLALSLTEVQRELMWRHLESVVETNEKFNLTRITSPAEAAVKHYADSLTLFTTGWVRRDQELTILDVGTGAGFPAVPLAIVCPSWRVTAIDGTGKKARFVSSCAELLGLNNLDAKHARAADLARGSGLQFDLVLLRAVTQIGPGIEEVKPLVTPGGAIVFYKSGRIDAEELRKGADIARRSGFSKTNAHDINMRCNGEQLERKLLRYARG